MGKNTAFHCFYLGLAASLISMSGHSASFNCAKAYGQVEKMICADPSLSAKDDALSHVYKKAKIATGNSAAFRALIKKNWDMRQKCTTRQCVSNWYDNSNKVYKQIIAQPVRSSCKNEGDKLSLAGTLLRITYPGPPNYESVANGDAPEVYWVLQPDHKIQCAKGASDFADHSKMQLVMYGNEYRDYASLVGKRVIVNGRLMYSMTGHHHTSLLIEVSKISAH